MTLFINGNNLNNPYWGLPRVSFELIKSLDDMFDEAVRKKIFGDVILLGRNKTSPMPNLKNIIYEYVPARNLYVWENLALARRTGKHPLLGLQNRNPVLKENCATMVHGIQVITQPASYSARARLEAKTILPIIGVRHRTILTVSEYSASELASYKIARRSKIRVVYNGIDHRETRSRADQPASSLDIAQQAYVLAQSSTKYHKNIRVLLEAFSSPRLSHLTLVLFGSDKAEQFEALGIRVPPNVRFVGTVGDDVLELLMRNAICLAFPSLTEGFGLPPLEAMLRGTPAIVSNGGAIPEVCGTSAVVVEPTNVPGWIDGIIQLSTDQALRDRLIDAGHRQAEKFSWSKSGQALFDVLAERHAV